LANNSDDYYPSSFTINLHTSQIIVDVLFLVVSVYVLNQSHGHWFFFNVLHILITMTLKLIEEFRISTGTLMDDDYVVVLELSFLTFNIKKWRSRYISFIYKEI